MEISNDSAELYSAACQGDINSAERLIDCYGLSYRPGWSQGYHLLRTVLKNNHPAVAILLLARGCSVKSENRTDAPLHLAARNGDLKIVRLLLDMGADVDARKNSDATPLHIAIYMNFEEIAELLIIEGADIDARTNSGITPLHVALNESEKIAKMLIERGADINARKENDLTPLHIALNNDLEEIAELLITKGADINARTKRGLTPLHVALKKDKRKIERLLIERGADTNATTVRGLTPLQIATKHRSWDIVDLLLRHGASVQELDKIIIANLNLAVARGFLPMSDGLSPVCDAIGKGDLETTRRLLQNGANVKDFPELLHVAVEKNYIEIVRELLFNGIDVNVVDAEGWTGLHFAIEENYIQIVQELLFNGVDVNVVDIRGWTGLHIAVWRKKQEIAQILLYSGADVDAQIKGGSTPLHLAVERGSVSMVRLLLGFHANPNLVRKGGSTTLHIAANRRNLRIVNMLLTEGAAVDAKTDDGYTALLYAAAICDNAEIIKLLLEKGAKVNEKADNGKIPIHNASVECDIRSVVALLDYGADVTISCRKSLTAFDYARETKEDAVLRNNTRELQRVNEVIDLLNRQRVKIEAAESIRSRPDAFVSSREKSLDDFYSECQLEAGRMRGEFIEDTNVSYYGILKKDSKSVAKCMKNKSVFLASRSEEYKDKFPIYAGMIMGQLQKGLARFELLQPARQVMSRLTGLTEVCTEHILEYLENDDLRVLECLEKDNSR